ncbi:uncharacterized protein LOC128093414 [Culex pipiens pallens]|uniref:uncharacterized protein LOC128093414 n=1 Tax=Culex pipiens pallens TaxID=42434 RepID=UPI0022AAF428|nr:uncharacterized protein LOC128093414 [Culex pipiens pallens]
MLAKRFGPPVDGLRHKVLQEESVHRWIVGEKVRSTGGRITGQGRKRNPSAGGRIAFQCWRKSSVHRWTDYARGIRPPVDGLPSNVGEKVRSTGGRITQEEFVRRWTDCLPMSAKRFGPPVDGLRHKVLQEESVRRWTDCLPMLAKKIGPPVDGLLDKDARGIRPPVDGLPSNVGEKVRSTGGRITAQGFARGIRPPVDGLPSNVGEKDWSTDGRITGQGRKRNPSAGGRIAFQCWRKGSVHRWTDYGTRFCKRNPSTGGRIAFQCCRKSRITGQGRKRNPSAGLARGIFPPVDRTSLSEDLFVSSLGPDWPER